MAEHRGGLKPILRRVGARRGERPRAVVRPRYEGAYVYGWVQPDPGRPEGLLLPPVNIEVFTRALAHFAQAVGAGPAKQVGLVLDHAGGHQSPRVRVPPGLHLIPRPPYSPELQPAERRWPLTNEPLANRTFATLAELDTVRGDRCVALAEQPARARAHTRFHCWPRRAA
jgi:hypothetical protein